MFWRMVIRSMVRRRRELRFVSLVTFIAVFFLSAVSVFQNVMNRYVTESNYDTYGEWVLSSVEDLRDTEIPFRDIDHPYLSERGVCSSGWGILDENEELSGICLGTMDENGLEIGNITLYEGHMPELADEIVMDLPTLAALGYSYDLGQEIPVTVLDGSGQQQSQTFRLVGTMKSFSENWVSEAGYSLPGGLVTGEGLEALGGTAFNTYFYQLDRKYENIDVYEFAAPFQHGDGLCEFNANAYGNRVWGSEVMFLAVQAVLILIAASASGYLLLSYEAERRRWHYQYRMIGAERAQIRTMVLIEGIYGIFPFALAALIIPHLAGMLICLIVSKWKGLPYFYEFHPGEAFAQAGIILGVLLLVITGTWLRSSDKTLVRNTREVTERQLKRLRKCKKGNTLKNFYRRQGKLHPLKRAAASVLSVCVCALLLLCINEIRIAVSDYQWAREELHDFEATKSEIYTDIFSPEDRLYLSESISNDGDAVTVESHFIDMYCGISRETEARLREIDEISSLDLQIWDERHTLEWEGKEKSPVMGAILKDYAYIGPGLESFRYYEDLDSMLADTGLKVTGTNLDEDAFNRGEQVIVYTGWMQKAPDPGSDAGKIEEEYVQETEIRPGMKMEITGRDYPAVTPVAVGEVIAPADSQEDEYHRAYVIFGSLRLAEKIAEADGQEPAYNKVMIDLDWSASFDSAEKKLATVFTEEKMEYRSNTEYVRRMGNNLISDLSIYGVTGLTLLLVYLVLQMNFYKNQSFYLHSEYRIMRNMGLERERFARLTLSDSLKRSLWVLPGIPAFWVLTLFNAYQDELQQAAAELGITHLYSTILGKMTSDPFWMAAEGLWQSGVWIFVILPAAAAAVLIGIYLLCARISIKDLEKI